MFFSARSLADADVANLFEDITFMSDSNFIDGEELHLLRSREDELREKHDIELQVLNRQRNRRLNPSTLGVLP